MSQTVAEALTPARLAVPEHTFTFPEKARRWKTDPQTITLREYTIETELDAIAASKTMAVLAYELLQRCIIRIDGKPADQGVGSICASWSPKVRQLALAAVNTIGVPEDDERGPFLASVVTVVP